MRTPAEPPARGRPRAREIAPGVHQLGAKLEELTPGTRMGGVVVGSPVTVVDVQWYGSNALTVTYRDDAGQVDQRLLYRDHEPSLSVESASRAYAFDGDPALFRLVAEGLRIRMAAQFDPMLAVTTSKPKGSRSPKASTRPPAATRAWPFPQVVPPSEQPPTSSKTLRHW